MKPVMALLSLCLLAVPLAARAFQEQPLPPGVEDIWKPAETPKGGVAWSLLESTQEQMRTDAEGFILSRPKFPKAVKALDGTTVRVAGWMMPLENSETQKHFVLLAYPPGCPFHLHAKPTQFIEVRTSKGLPIEFMDPIVIEGRLELTGEDESGIFYRITGGRRI